jgi:diacylglycerol kinase (ATP)
VDLSAPESPHKGRTGIVRVWYSLGYSLAGLGAAFKHEDAFRQECILAAVLIPVALYLGHGGVARALLIGSVLLSADLMLVHKLVTLQWADPSRSSHELRGEPYPLFIYRLIGLWTTSFPIVPSASTA